MKDSEGNTKLPALPCAAFVPGSLIMPVVEQSVPSQYPDGFYVKVFFSNVNFGVSLCILILLPYWDYFFIRKKK